MIPDRNLALELVRVTETAALAAAPWVGRGEKDLADGAAVKAMRAMINTVDMSGIVVIGEGEKDQAPMLHNGEQVGNGDGPNCDVAVDPIDGTSLTAQGMNGAISVIALAPRGSMFDPQDSFYMNKIVTGPDAAHVIDIKAVFPDNELGFIGQQIVEVYNRLQKTKKALSAERGKLIRHLQISHEGIAVFSKEKLQLLANNHFIQYLNIISEFIKYSFLTF
mgnify:CR=1 FL=1